MDELTFARFVEFNDHEGETWTWWLQIDGNESQLDRLRDLLADADVAEEYDLRLDIVEPESVVDELREHAVDGYFAGHNKVLGRLTCPDSLGEYADILYKGGIRDLFMTDGSS
jgi:hypothetical protein